MRLERIHHIHHAIIDEPEGWRRPVVAAGIFPGMSSRIA
jgi:hypothetical protein